jgi:hypothetical protein
VKTVVFQSALGPAMNQLLVIRRSLGYSDRTLPSCRWRRKRVPVWRWKRSHRCGYAMGDLNPRFLSVTRLCQFRRPVDTDATGRPVRRGPRPGREAAIGSLATHSDSF